MIFAIFGLLYKKKDLLVWKFLLMFSFLLALGPYLIVGGRSLFFGTKIYLPFFFIKYIPLLNKIDRLTTVSIMMLIAAIVLMSYALAKILLKYNVKNSIKTKYILLGVVLAIILFESLSIPLVITSPIVPDFYKKVPAGDYAILELPLAEQPSNIPSWFLYYSFDQYYQRIHEKRILGGYLARNTDPQIKAYTDNLPFISRLKYPDRYPDSHDFEKNQSNRESAINELKASNIRFVVLHWAYLANMIQYKQNLFNISVENYNVQDVNETLGMVFDHNIYYQDDQIIVYAVE